MSATTGVAIHTNPDDVVKLLTSVMRASAAVSRMDAALFAERMFALTIDWPASDATDMMRQACNAILLAEVES